MDFAVFVREYSEDITYWIYYFEILKAVQSKPPPHEYSEAVPTTWCARLQDWWRSLVILTLAELNRDINPLLWCCLPHSTVF